MLTVRLLPDVLRMLCLGLALLVDPWARAGAAPPIATLRNPTPAEEDLFGWAVAAVGPNVVVAEPADDVGRNSSGSVHLFAPTGALIRTIPNPIPQPGGPLGPRFGWSVAALGSNILVGASVFQEGTGPCAADPNACTAAGTVFLIDPNVAPSGAVLHRFVNPSPNRQDQFGMAVAAIGSDVLIGAPFDNAGGLADSGAAYLYRFESGTWVLRKMFVSPRPTAGERFGMAVAALGDDVVIGAPFKHVSGFFPAESPQAGPGSVYRFRFDGSEWHPTIYDTPSGTTDAFGQSVATPGGQLLVGAPHDTRLVTGAAYLIDAATGTRLHTFRSPTTCTRTDSCQQFGFAVAALGPDALVGSFYDEAAGNDAGAAYLFRSANGRRAGTFLAAMPIAGEEFGVAVATLGNVVAIGAGKARTAAGTRAGAVFLFEAPRCGDGTRDPDEGCDAGADLPTECCAADCTVVNASRGDPCGDRSQGPCDDPNTCNTAGECLENHKPDDFACPDDGNECTKDFCDGAGACAHPPQPTAFPCLDDGNPCTGDYCDGLGSCVPELTEKDGDACDNGDPVCLGDTCQEGMCRNYQPCQNRIDENKAEPDPRNPANVLLTCSAGVPGEGNFCAVEAATVNLADAALVVSDDLDPKGRLVLRKKQVRSKAGVRAFPLDPVSGKTTRTLKLNALGKKLLRAAGRQNTDLPVTLDVVIVANQERTSLKLLAELRKKVR